MRWKSLAGVVAMAAGALVVGALFGRPGVGHASGNAPPKNTSAPQVSGIPQEGETLTADKGSWSGSPTPTYTFQWKRCDANGNNCSSISGATAKTYKLVAKDVGKTLRITVTAKNSEGKTSATSVPTAVVSSAQAPKNTAPPTVSGSLAVGSTLTAKKGTWSGNVKSYAYAWLRCDKHGSSCSTISGATSASYKLTAADVGTTLRVAVTAKNGAGSTTATSVPTDVVPLPVVSGCPSGTGTIQVADLAPPARLAIDQQSVTPSVVRRSTAAIRVHFRVTACGRPVQGARVFAVSIPYDQFRGTSGTTGADGTVTLTESQQDRFPASRRQERLVMLLRANQPAKSVVAGVSTRRVVSFRMAR